MTEKSNYPEWSAAFDTLLNQPIAFWYTDRVEASILQQTIQHGVIKCDENEAPLIVLYGLPGKDCNQYSSEGSNNSPEQYAAFIDGFLNALGSHPAIIVLEPDAIGLLNQCPESGFLENMQYALSTIARRSPKSHVYVDIGYWTLDSNEKINESALFLQTLSNVKGIVLNTSNYRTSKEMIEICEKYSAASDNQFHCLIDTSRNYKGPIGNEWCNAENRGIGIPPTSVTGSPSVDYFVYIKPPGESDGECNQTDRSQYAMTGPKAGAFFPKAFVQLWNNGYFREKNLLPPISVINNREATVAPSLGCRFRGL